MNFKKIFQPENNRIIVKNILFAFIIKGGSLIISFLTTPAFIRYFDNNVVLGVWYTMLSVLLWFLNFDLGIGNGIRNRLVKDLAANNMQDAKKTISSGMLSNGIVALVLLVAGFGILNLVDLRWMFNIDESEISYKILYLSTLFVFFAIIIRFFLTTVSSIFYALQKSAVNDFLLLCVSVLQLVFVHLADFGSAENNLLGLSIAYMVLSNLPLVVAGIIVFSTKLKACAPDIRHVNKEYLKSILNVGTVFFVCQILYMLIINTNEFLITSQYGPEYTTEYSFYYKLTSLVSMMITLAMAPIWSIVTKAMAEKNYTWLSKLYKVLKLIGAAAIVLQVALIPFQQFVMDLWLQKNSITVDPMIALSFAIFGGAFVYSSILSTIVCGMARMKIQTIFYGVGVVLKFALIFVFANMIKEWVFVVWCNVLVLVPYCIAQQIDLDRYIKKLKINNN